MSKQDQLKALVISTLRSDPCKSVAFTIVGSTIMGYGYGYIADMIGNGVVRVTQGDTGGFTAKYDHPDGGRPTMTFSPDFAGNEEGLGTIVHEATHAVMDAVRVGRTISFGDNEVAGYLAETIYKIYAGFSFNKKGPVSGPLYQLASTITCYCGETVYAVQPSQTQALKTTLMNGYTAIAAAQGKRVPATLKMQGIGL